MNWRELCAHWKRGGRSVDRKITRIASHSPLHCTLETTTYAGGPFQDTFFAAPQRRDNATLLPSLAEQEKIRR